MALPARLARASTTAVDEAATLDEEAGRMRLQLAAESKTRKAEEAERLAQENRLYYERVATAVAKVDDDRAEAVDPLLASRPRCR